jgi:hypothetical protein
MGLQLKERTQIDLDVKSRDGKKDGIKSLYGFESRELFHHIYYC